MFKITFSYSQFDCACDIAKMYVHWVNFRNHVKSLCRRSWRGNRLGFPGWALDGRHRGAKPGYSRISRRKRDTSIINNLRPGQHHSDRKLHCFFAKTSARARYDTSRIQVRPRFASTRSGLLDPLSVAGK